MRRVDRLLLKVQEAQPLPLYILYLPMKRSPQQQQVKERSTQGKEHFTPG